MLPTDYGLEDYRIIGVLGVGGFGITYVASDETLEERVAIKEFLPAGVASHDGDTVRPVTESKKENYERLLQDFIAESRHIARIRHPNVVRVRRCFKRNGTAYMVMDYEDGEDLQTWLQHLGRTPTETETLRIAGPLLDGLEAVHGVGLIHRDIKPQNVFIRHGDGSPVLLDFGAARHEDASHFTAILTAGYAPIEQYEEEARQGPWTDIYGLAAVLYRAVTGTKPQAALNRMAMDRLRPAVEACSGAYSEALLRGIDAGLALSPEDRPRSVAEWRHGWLPRPEPLARPATAGAHKRARPARDEDDADATVRLPTGAPADPPLATVPTRPVAPRPDPAETAPPPPAPCQPAPCEPAAPAEVAPADRAAWSRAAAAHTVEAYREYLAAFAGGAFASRARDAISAIGEPGSPEPETPAATPSDAAGACLSWPGFAINGGAGVARVIEIPPDEAAEDGPRRFDFLRPSFGMLGLLGFFGLVEMVVSTLILLKVFHGDGLTAVPLAVLVTFGFSLGFAMASREVNAWSAAVWSALAALGAALLEVILFGRFLF